MFRAAIAIALLVLAGCIQSEKKADTKAVDRRVASEEKPEFDPNRYQFNGTIPDFWREYKLLNAGLETKPVLGIAAARDEMLVKNLYDTGVDPNGDLDCNAVMAEKRQDNLLFHRTPEGTCYMYRQKFDKHQANLSELLRMGAKGQRFGRNSPPPTEDELNARADRNNIEFPNPVEVSKTFFSRTKEEFKPVPWVNFLATAWLQAENHDWFTHGKNIKPENAPKGHESNEAMMALFKPFDFAFGGKSYTIFRTQPDRTRLLALSTAKDKKVNAVIPDPISGQNYSTNGGAVSAEKNEVFGQKYRNGVTHWWDASHIYGSDIETIEKVRSIPKQVGMVGLSVKSKANPANTLNIYPYGKIAVDKENKKLYYAADPNNDNEVLPITGFHDNWWIGLEMIHTTFALEHNEVAEALRTHFQNTKSTKPLYAYYASIAKDPVAVSNFLFEKSRLIVSALIAKIHTVEWTPALLDNAGLRLGMYINWNGAKTAVGDPDFELARGLIARLGLVKKGTQQLVSGLVGPNTLNLFNVPFTLTEEFVSVYRMHSLLADEINVLDHRQNDDKIRTANVEVNDTRDTKSSEMLEKNSSTDWMFSFGRAKAGQMTLHNYPTFMQDIEIRRNLLNQKLSDEKLIMNMGATDIMRDRERQVPRYNAFRRMLGLRPLSPGKFVELFITSKVAYEPETDGQSEEYKNAIAKIRNKLAENHKAIPVIERDLEKVPGLGTYAKRVTTKVLSSAAKGLKGAVGFAKRKLHRENAVEEVKAEVNAPPPGPPPTLATEDEFYQIYYSLSVEDQEALLTDQEKSDIKAMERIYEGDVEKLDLLVGTLAEEDRYDSFGFGNTPFYIFALMASRRLMTDPFLSDLYTEDIYSSVGLNWVESNTMLDVLARNFPGLGKKVCKGNICDYTGHFSQVKNAFHPWNPENVATAPE